VYLFLIPRKCRKRTKRAYKIKNNLLSNNNKMPKSKSVFVEIAPNLKFYSIVLVCIFLVYAEVFSTGDYFLILVFAFLKIQENKRLRGIEYDMYRCGYNGRKEHDRITKNQISEIDRLYDDIFNKNSNTTK